VKGAYEVGTYVGIYGVGTCGVATYVVVGFYAVAEI
jgi:hypothetical protein